MKACPECGTKNLNSNQSCDECGASLEQALRSNNTQNIPNNDELLKKLKSLSDKISQIEINTRNSQNIAISDVNMKFGSMVIFMIKWAIATIPAAIILLIIGSIFMAVFTGIFSAMIR